MNRVALYGLAVLIVLTGCRKDVSGSYLGGDPSSVSWLQIVRTPDDHLTGQIVSSDLKSDGKITQNSAPITGAVNGENLTLTLNGFLGLGDTTFSGTFNGNSLTLTGVQSTPVVLKRAALADYQAQLQAQVARSQAVISAKAAADARKRALKDERNFVDHVDRIISDMQNFDSEADIHLGRFPNVEKDYGATTSKVNEYVTRESQLAGRPNQNVARSQLYVAANQASLSADQLHFQGQSLESTLKTNIAPLGNEVTRLERGCHENQSPDTDADSEEIEERGKACDRLFSAAAPFRQKYEAVKAGLDHLEIVYKREKNSQERLLDRARQLNN